MECSFLALFVLFLIGLVQVTNASERSILHKRATGATDYAKGDYPFHVSFWFTGEGNHVAEGSDGRRHVYGGVLIDPYWVLTAYKIFFESSPYLIEDPINIHKWKVVLGMHAQTDANREAEFHEIAEIKTSLDVHDNNNEKLALVKLTNPAILSDTIRPANYSSDRDCPGYDELTVLGWGPITCDGDFATSSNFPHKMTNKALQPDECYPNNAYREKYNRQFCAAVDKNIRSDLVDIGSPVLATCDDKEEVVGLVLDGSGCGSQYNPDFYIKISAYARWIKKTING